MLRRHRDCAPLRSERAQKFDEHSISSSDTRHADGTRVGAAHQIVYTPLFIRMAAFICVVPISAAKIYSICVPLGMVHIAGVSPLQPHQRDTSLWNPLQGTPSVSWGWVPRPLEPWWGFGGNAPERTRFASALNKNSPIFSLGLNGRHFFDLFIRNEALRSGQLGGLLAGSTQ
jgi:hypothetical protein